METVHPVHTGQTVTIATYRGAEEAATDEIGPGILAFTIVVLLGVATFLLLRSMMHHIRKVPPTFETEDRDDAGSSGRPDGDPDDPDHPGPEHPNQRSGPGVS